MVPNVASKFFVKRVSILLFILSHSRKSSATLLQEYTFLVFGVPKK